MFYKYIFLCLIIVLLEEQQMDLLLKCKSTGPIKCTSSLSWGHITRQLAHTIIPHQAVIGSTCVCLYLLSRSAPQPAEFVPTSNYKNRHSKATSGAFLLCHGSFSWIRVCCLLFFDALFSLEALDFFLFSLSWYSLKLCFTLFQVISPGIAFKHRGPKESLNK